MLSRNLSEVETKRRGNQGGEDGINRKKEEGRGKEEKKGWKNKKNLQQAGS